jgi:hypothetical protein
MPHLQIEQNLTIYKIRLTKSVARLRKALEKELTELDVLIDGQIRGSAVWVEEENLLASSSAAVTRARAAPCSSAPWSLRATIRSSKASATNSSPLASRSSSLSSPSPAS